LKMPSNSTKMDEVVRETVLEILKQAPEDSEDSQEKVPRKPKAEVLKRILERMASAEGEQLDKLKHIFSLLFQDRISVSEAEEMLRSAEKSMRKEAVAASEERLRELGSKILRATRELEDKRYKGLLLDSEDSTEGEC